MKEVTFHDFKVAVAKQFTKMEKLGIYVANISKDVIWDTYLGSFAEGTDPIYRERTTHDCNCCKRFIRQGGSALTFDSKGELVSVWDVKIGGIYQVVADALSKAVKESGIDSIFLHPESNIGEDKSIELNDDGTITYHHFHHKLLNQFVKDKHQIATLQSTARSQMQVLKRSVEEITSEAIESVLELITSDNLYRGAEHKSIVTKLMQIQIKTKFNKSNNSDKFFWEESKKLGGASAIRNTVIGTLLVDLSTGVPLEYAVKMFESKVAPSNYKRSKALVTPAMMNRAQEKVQELGIESALPRRFAKIEDITINNVLWADRSAKESMGVFDVMKSDVVAKKPSMDNLEEVSIKDFMKDILPQADTIELMVENRHKGNMMSLIAPVEASAKGILRWGNNFSFTYNGDVTDSMVENVKKAGGNTEGVLRFSIQWNDNDDNKNDLDAHCSYPDGYISFQEKNHAKVAASLDVDIQRPTGVAVENIIFTDINKMRDGSHYFYVHNYSGRNGRNWSAQIAFEGTTYEFSHEGTMKSGQKIHVGTVVFDKKTKTMKLTKSMEHSESKQDVWGVTTNSFQKVSVVMNSPNHWDGEETGNLHQFFILEDCLNPDDARGLYNEFLSSELHDHRKVLEVLGSKLKAPNTDEQLSGLGFSSTKRDSVVVRVTGTQPRCYKINF